MKNQRRGEDTSDSGDDDDDDRRVPRVRGLRASASRVHQHPATLSCTRPRNRGPEILALSRRPRSASGSRMRACVRAHASCMRACVSAFNRSESFEVSPIRPGNITRKKRRRRCRTRRAPAAPIDPRHHYCHAPVVHGVGQHSAVHPVDKRRERDTR